MMTRYFKVQFCLVLFVLSAATSIGATKISSEENGVNRLVIHVDQGKNTIAPEIYGHFADEYHWAEGIGPRDKRPKMVNTHWGMVTETNAFGTHEFLDLCEQLACEAYVAGNVGSGTLYPMYFGAVSLGKCLQTGRRAVYLTGPPGSVAGEENG